MAIKKSELYGSLWSSCDVLRGGMDASQYQDYVLVLLFIKYISEKSPDMDAEIASLEAKLAKARRLKQGMMQELLTGRGRLIN
jgi:type I restriction-modification system DNA methylase subunit